MPSTYMPEKFAVLAADGTADGLANVTANSGWLPGATGWLAADTQTSLHVAVIEAVGADRVRLRLLGAPATGFVNISAYTTARNASLSLEGQTVPVDAPFSPRPRA